MTTHQSLFTEIVHQPHWQKLMRTGSFMLAGDIGGTNSNFGVMEISTKKPILCLSLHAKSQTIKNFSELCSVIVEHLIKRYNLTVTRLCIGVAGVIGQQRTQVKPTNLTIVLDTHELIQAIPQLTQCTLINDFEAVGLGLDSIDPAAVVTINPGKGVNGAQKACIGAGTGLGKVALFLDKHSQHYLPLASEGGHADCSAQSEQEYAFFKFLQERDDRVYPVSWERVLSGNGISSLYQFLGETKTYLHTSVHEEIRTTGFKPDLISRYSHEDKHCYDTFVMYTIFYARCAKNFALDVLAQNGLYISGGIAAKNLSLFTTEQFREHFFASSKQSNILHDIPLFVITDYNISLYGAAMFFILRDQGIL
jgi:glucokinase